MTAFGLRPKNTPLPPHVAAACIEAGQPAADIFAHLDLRQCQFREAFDTAGYKGPAIPMEGFGRLAKGHLAFTPEKVAEYKAAGIPYISIIPDEHSPFLQKGKHKPYTDVMIFGKIESGYSMNFFSPDHFSVFIGAANMAWLRNLSMTAHYAAPASGERNYVTINGINLYEGDIVSVDGRGEALYPCDMPIKSVQDAVLSLDAAAKEKALPAFRVLANAKDFMSVNDAALSTSDGIGLLRTEEMVNDSLVFIGNNFVEPTTEEVAQEVTRCNLDNTIYSKPQLYAAIDCLFDTGKKSDALKKTFKDRICAGIFSELQRSFFIANSERKAPHQTYPVTYRLTDLEASQLELGGTKFITPANKKQFFALQAAAAFQAFSEDGASGIISMLVPSARSAEELAEIKEEVDKAAKQYGFIDGDGKRLYRFGAMMETRDAVEPKTAAGIAKLCDFVSFGTNDLTKEITGLERNDLDPEVKARGREWMQHHRCAHLGATPFDALVPPVTHAMEAAVRAMRLANPKLEIGCCGRQVASNPAAIESCMKMGLDNISVPPQDVPASRIMAAHFLAKQRLAAASR